jgi:hypothetical protein
MSPSFQPLGGRQKISLALREIVTNEVFLPRNRAMAHHYLLTAATLEAQAWVTSSVDHPDVRLRELQVERELEEIPQIDYLEKDLQDRLSRLLDEISENPVQEDFQLHLKNHYHNPLRNPQLPNKVHMLLSLHLCS